MQKSSEYRRGFGDDPQRGADTRPLFNPKAHRQTSHPPAENGGEVLTQRNATQTGRKFMAHGDESFLRTAARL